MKPIPGCLLLLASLTVTIACNPTPSSQSIVPSIETSAIGTDAAPVAATGQAPATSPSTVAAAPKSPEGAASDASDAQGSGESPSPSPNAERPTAAAPSSPISPQAVLTDLYDRRAELGLCPDGFDAATSPNGSMVYPIGDNQYLVQMMCFMAAYQGSYEYLMYTTTAGKPQVKALKLARFQADENGQLSMLEEQQVGGLPEYHPGQQQLTVVTKFSGMGTCGSLATYQVQGDQLQLVAYRAKFACDETVVDPSQYPQIFP